MKWRIFLFFLTITYVTLLVRCQFNECHDDPSDSPSEGTLEEVDFTWLGVLQYIHIKNGTPNYFRVPRVILITRQFVLCIAADAAQVPDEYALGNVAFGDYERDEEECHLTFQEIAAGASCDTATLLMPIADVLLHPEYKHFGARDSLAILKLAKPIKSVYVVPACLPFKDFLTTYKRKQSTDKFFHVDYVSDVPRDFIDEDKDIKKVALLPRELCYLYDDEEHPQNLTSLKKNRMMCTTGCGFHSGAPTLVHEHTGHWSVVAMSLGGSSCPDPLRPRRPPAPPKHIIIYPYVAWITAAISGKPIGAYAKDDPFGIMMPRVWEENLHDIMFHEWVGHYWMGGPRCHDRGPSAEDLFKFYSEIFQIKSIEGETFLKYNLEINAPISTTVICVKVGVPFRLGKPKVVDLNSPAARISIPLIRLYHTYRIVVDAFGYNKTISLVSSSSSVSGCSGSDPPSKCES